MDIDKYNLSYSAKSTLVGTNEVDVNLTLTNTVTNNNGNIKGHVYDSNGKPIPGATVKIFDQSFTPFMHTVTQNDGSYQILNVPPANYKINATATGYLYGTSSQIYVAENDITKVDFNLNVDDNYNKNAIAGLLYIEGTSTPIKNAKILVKDSDGNEVSVTYTADDGEFLITDLSDGTYTVEPICNGYNSLVVHSYTVLNGGIYNVILYMISVSADIRGTYTGQILDSTGMPIHGSIVGLYKIDSTGKETLVSLMKTNIEGRYMFGNVEAGDYIVKAKDVTTKTQIVSSSSTTTTTTASSTTQTEMPS